MEHKEEMMKFSTALNVMHTTALYCIAPVRGCAAGYTLHTAPLSLAAI